jgi:hypothetical protein
MAFKSGAIVSSTEVVGGEPLEAMESLSYVDRDY